MPSIVYLNSSFAHFRTFVSHRKDRFSLTVAGLVPHSMCPLNPDTRYVCQPCIGSYLHLYLQRRETRYTRRDNGGTNRLRRLGNWLNGAAKLQVTQLLRIIGPHRGRFVCVMLPHSVAPVNQQKFPVRARDTTNRTKYGDRS